MNGSVYKVAVQETENNIATYIENKALENNKAFTVEEIQDLVENGLMSTKRKDVAKAYIKYRQKRSEARSNTTDKELEELFRGTSKYWNTENSNKDATNITVQRDYIAGITSTDITRRASSFSPVCRTWRRRKPRP